MLFVWQTGLFRKELSFEKYNITTTIKYYIKKGYCRLKKGLKGSRKIEFGYFIN